MSTKSIEAALRSDGRAGRVEYWIVNILGIILFSLIEPYRHSEPTWVFWLFLIPSALYAIHITIKRAHDRNRSFLFVLLFLIPIVWFWPAIELAFFARVDKNNAYGTRAH